MESAENRTAILAYRTTGGYWLENATVKSAATLCGQDESVGETCSSSVRESENKNDLKAIRHWNHYLLVRQTGFEPATC